jgi:hypothetical protein
MDDYRLIWMIDIARDARDRYIRARLFIWEIHLPQMMFHLEPVVENHLNWYLDVFFEESCCDG